MTELIEEMCTQAGLTFCGLGMTKDNALVYATNQTDDLKVYTFPEIAQMASAKLDVTPEQQVRNVVNALLSLVDGPPHQHRMDAIRSTTYQLNEIINKYIVGELEPIPPNQGQ